jgi:hypothetical protein
VKLALAMMFCNQDLPFLKLHFPVLRACFEKIYCATGDDTDCEAADYLRTNGVQIIPLAFDNNWAEFWNKFIITLMAHGVERMIRLDPDELMFPDHIAYVDILLNHFELIGFPRWNFWYDRTQYNINAYPDSQWRAWRLEGHVSYFGTVHEGISFSGQRDEIALPMNIPIFHYGDIGKANINVRALRYINYDLVNKGLPTVKEIPPGRQPGAATTPFTDPQPLDPVVIGKYAPFEE